MCKCVQGRKLTTNSTCVQCADIYGIGADSSTCSCAMYAEPDQNAECNCIDGFIETTNV